MGRGAVQTMSRFIAITLFALFCVTKAATVLKCYQGSKTAKDDDKWKKITCNPSADGCYAIYQGETESVLGAKIDPTIYGGCASRFMDSRTLCAVLTQAYANVETGQLYCGGKCNGDECNDKMLSFDHPGDGITSNFSASTPTIIIFFIISVLLTVAVFFVILIVFLPKKMDKNNA